MTTFEVTLAGALDAYFDRYPREADEFEALKPVFSSGDRLFDRLCLPYHWTASAWIVEPARQQGLLLFHRKLQRWIQSGGHADGDTDLPAVALREAREETGLASLLLDSRAIFDFDVTPIPERGDVPAHYHLDARYLLWAERSEPIVESSESVGARWFDLSTLAAEGNDAGVRRMAVKTMNLPGGS
jgi:8-oxo-dGTP pyrophosphatase MutT (NUDIX family)